MFFYVFYVKKLSNQCIFVRKTLKGEQPEMRLGFQKKKEDVIQSRIRTGRSCGWQLLYGHVIWQLPMQQSEKECATECRKQSNRHQQT